MRMGAESFQEARPISYSLTIHLQMPTNATSAAALKNVEQLFLILLFFAPYALRLESQFLDQLRILKTIR